MYTNSPPSIWKLSELLTWSDFNFIDNSDRTDVENYCSFIGAYDICTMFRGIVPIVHGPLSCISSYYSTRIATRLKEKIKPRPFASCMDANDIIFGATDKLSEVVKETDQLYHPRLIVILTTCVSDMITEDIDTVVRKLKDDVGADILIMRIGGITCNGFRAGADYAFKMLMDYVKEKAPQTPKKANSINLFLRRVNGKLSEDKDIHEITKMLGMNGITINSVVRIGMSYDELLQLPQAQANATLCFTYGKEVLKHMQTIYEQPYSSVSYPLGIAGTKTWVRSVCEVLQVTDNFSNSPEMREAERVLEEVKKFLADKMKDKRMFIWHAGEKALAFSRLAYDLGLEPVIVGLTYYLFTANRETMVNMINEGCDPPVIIKGYQKLWADYEKQCDYYERPVMFMPKKAWSGDLPTVDIDLFRDCALGIGGFYNIVQALYKCYTTEPGENHSIFDRYLHRLYEKVEWNKTMPKAEAR